MRARADVGGQGAQCLRVGMRHRRGVGWQPGEPRCFDRAERATTAAWVTGALRVIVGRGGGGVVAASVTCCEVSEELGGLRGPPGRARALSVGEVCDLAGSLAVGFRCEQLDDLLRLQHEVAPRFAT